MTGAGSGIGAATAIALAKAGVRVSIAGRRIDALKATAASLDKHAGIAVSIDVTDEAAVTKGIAQIETEVGPIDILVNNAGKAASAPFDKTGAALWADMIISAGYNIAGPEVEAALLGHPDVAECAVIGAPDEERGQIVSAFIVLKQGARTDEVEVKLLQDHVKATIAPYKYPRAIAFVEALPKTQTGKIQRFKLREAS